MPTANLTDRKVASLKTENDKTYWYDSKLKGFGVMVTFKGTKTWFFHYRFAGKRPRMKLGRYPDVQLFEARKKAQKALSLLSDGKDPANEKKLEEAERIRQRIESKTFDQLCEQYLNEYAKIHKKRWSEDERLIKLLIPEFGTLNVKDVRRSHIRSFLRTMAIKTPVQANRAKACLSKIFNWAIDEEIVEIENNPAARISNPGGKEKPKERSLNDEELMAVWIDLKDNSSPVRRALQLVLLTGQRPGEVVGILLEELGISNGNSIWLIPASRTKNGIANLIPLSNLATRVIEKQRRSLQSQNAKRENRGQRVVDGLFLFPCRHILKQKSMTVYALDREAQRISKALEFPPFTPHDLRRTCSTKLAEMGFKRDIRDRVLNHKPTGVTDTVYNQYDYLKEKREALDALGGWIARLTSEFELRESSQEDEKEFIRRQPARDRV